MARIKSGGRTKGTPNKLNQELREVLKQLFDNQIEKIKPLFDELPMKERLDFLAKLLPYLLPKMENPDINTDYATPTITIISKSQEGKQVFEDILNAN